MVADPRTIIRRRLADRLLHPKGALVDELLDGIVGDLAAARLLRPVDPSPVPGSADQQIPDAVLDAFLLAQPIGWSGRIDEVHAGLAAAYPLLVAAVLRAAYWKLRQHASAKRSTRQYRQWQEMRDDRRETDQRRGHAADMLRRIEMRARGIEDAAADIAELLGVPEHEIEEPVEPAVFSPVPDA